MNIGNSSAIRLPVIRFCWKVKTGKNRQKNRDAGDASLGPACGNIPLFHLDFMTLLFRALRQGEL